MVRRSLIAAAFFLAAAPLAAQSQNPMSGPTEYQWSSDRPDANGPMGVFGSRTMEEGEIEVSYRYYQTNWQGLYFRTDSVGLVDALNLYDDVPISRRDVRHELRLSWGLSQNLTLMARGNFAVMERETFSNGAPIRNSVEELGDVEVGALYNVYASGPYRMQVEAGAVIPTGASRTYADTTRAQTGTNVTLPYDMRPGGGTFGMILGIGGTAQNEFGSLGAQFRLRSHFGENDAGFKKGDNYEASGWAAYNLTDAFSMSSGIRWEKYRNIQGMDPTLNFFGDPHNASEVLSGQRAHLPIGVNFMMPQGNRFAGHRISAEAVYTLHHDMGAPQLGMDWGFNFGYTIGF